MILAGILELWNSSWPAGLIMFSVGLLFAIVLLIASEKLKVKQDPRVERIMEIMPGANCGACGFAGCQEYASAVVADPLLLGKCFPGGQRVLDDIARILNLQASNSGALKRPVVHCRAHTNDKTYYAKYHGIPSCLAANALTNAQTCKFGCLGFGDCVRACRFNALHIVDGLAAVDYEKCTGCAACSKTCPRNLIKMVPFAYENMMTVACSNKETGKVTRSMCTVGCIACGLCTKQSDSFSVEDNLAHLDPQKYQPGQQTETAMNKCPTGVIIYVGKNAPQPRQSAEKPAAAKV